jgi:hypothetical protein
MDADSNRRLVLATGGWANPSPRLERIGGSIAKVAPKSVSRDFCELGERGFEVFDGTRKVGSQWKKSTG